MKRMTFKSLLALVLTLGGIITAGAAQLVEIQTAGQGEVIATPQAPQAGDVVTLTVTPAVGYAISKEFIHVEATLPSTAAQAPRGNRAVKVGYPIELQGDEPSDPTKPSSYTFVMPDEPYGVLIDAQFIYTGVTAVTHVGADRSVTQVKYVDLNGMVSDSPQSGVNVVVTTFSDGSTVATKQLVR